VAYRRLACPLVDLYPSGAHNGEHAEEILKEIGMAKLDIMRYRIERGVLRRVGVSCAFNRYADLHRP
jgi:hypothetical protein